ncbi:nucleotide-diphospho-sugar transferase [Pholiota molesta]|nr:nucleotide-diphospho-sugar transferase [Pholiota molesta]
MPSKAAYVTLLTSISYLPGVLVLNQSLRRVKSKYRLVVMVTPSLPDSARKVLSRQRIGITEVETLRPPEGKHNLHAHDSRFADTWTKLRAFGLVQFERIVLLDSDMIVLKNMDELMDTDLRGNDHIGAVHVCACNPRALKHYPLDWKPANCAYSTVKISTAKPPSIQQNSRVPLRGIQQFLASHPRVSEWAFPDQDLLSEYFKGKWHPIPWSYNAFRSHRNVHPAMWSEDEVRCLHYIYADKPWQSRITPSRSDKGFDVMDRWWWDRFDALAERMKMDDPEGWALVLSTVDIHKKCVPTTSIGNPAARRGKELTYSSNLI